MKQAAEGFSAGVINTGLPKPGLFGEPVTQPAGPAAAVGIGTMNRDPVVQAMIDVGSFHQPPDIIPELKDRDAREQHAFIQGKGRLQRQFVTRIVNSSNFQNLPADKKRRLIDQAFVRASKIANNRGRNAARAGVPITPQLLTRGFAGLR